VQRQRHLGVLRRVLGGAVQRHFVEADRVRPLAADLLVPDRAAAEVPLGEVVHVVAAVRLQHVALQHGVVPDAGQPTP